MEIIEISSRYEKIPVPVFEQEINSTLKEIKQFESLID